ncbi:MAG: LuxR C-terminal-related transcriptional regulator, partial [Oscillospiraceae bacterium]
VKNENHREIVKVGIAEIDDLFAYLSKQDEEKEKLQQLLQNKDKPSQAETDNDKPNLVAYREFVHNIQTLSPAEMSVFNLYMKGNTAKEIASILYLSMNTIKTHNKRIYSKLNVTSRKELMIFVQMMSKEESEDNLFN